MRFQLHFYFHRFFIYLIDLCYWVDLSQPCSIFLLWRIVICESSELSNDLLWQIHNAVDFIVYLFTRESVFFSKIMLNWWIMNFWCFLLGLRPSCCRGKEALKFGREISKVRSMIVSVRILNRGSDLSVTETNWSLVRNDLIMNPWYWYGFIMVFI
jgi:hypothetical protein